MDTSHVKSKDKRRSYRIPLLDEYMDVQTTNHVFKKAKMHNINKNGVFILSTEINKFPAINDFIYAFLKLPGDLGQITILSKVKRYVWTKSKKKPNELGFALEFCMDENDSNWKIISAYLVYVQNKQIIAVSKRIIEEFFGQNAPK